MTGGGGSRRCLDALRAPGLLPRVAAGAVGRLPLGMTPLGADRPGLRGRVRPVRAARGAVSLGVLFALLATGLGFGTRTRLMAGIAAADRGMARTTSTEATNEPDHLQVRSGG